MLCRRPGHLLSKTQIPFGAMLWFDVSRCSAGWPGLLTDNLAVDELNFQLTALHQ
jgi:hypothetical protein